MFETESPTLYDAWVKSGEIPNCINIGTKIGAIKAHFAEAEPMNKFTNAVSNKIPTIVTSGANAIAFNPDAPFKANNAPRFDLAKASINKAQKNAITM